MTIKQNSVLADNVGTTKIRPVSGHHQAVNKVADGLCVVASAPDNTIEAVKHITHPWCIGLQWHPERTTETDPTHQAIFDALIREAK